MIYILIDINDIDYHLDIYTVDYVILGMFINAKSSFLVLTQLTIHTRIVLY